jgi:hypothetical protein
MAGFAAITAVALLRQAGVPATQTIWAEDGRIFYSQALRSSFWRTLTVLHDGYAQLFPRLAVQATRIWAPADAATVMAWAGAMSFAVLACLVFHMAKGHIRSPFMRGLLVAGMVLLPVANVELLDNLVNVPWWLFFAAFWALLWRPRTLPGQVVAGVACLLAAGSEPLVALFLPVAGARAFSVGRGGTRPGRWGRWLAEQAPSVGLVLGLAYQVAVISTSGTSTPVGQGGAADAVPSFAIRAGLGLFGGERATDWLDLHQKGLSVVLGVLVLAVVLAAGLAARSPRVRAFVAVAAGFSAVCFIVPVWVRGLAAVMWADNAQVASRYEVVSLLLLISAVTVIGDQFMAGDGARLASSRRAVLVAALCAALFAPAWAIDFHDRNQRSDGPRWSSQVARGTTACARRAAVDGGSPGATATLAIDPPGWTSVVPCGDLVPAQRAP